MTPHDIRTLYLDFFKSKGHVIVESDSLIPSKDPTLLFTTAGMVQFKSLYAGAPLNFSTAASCQTCLRAGGKNSDLENVGKTLRHHTFFEMLGNFSFGDYFKKEAIEYALEFLLDILKMDKSKLWVSVFEQDDEAKELWIKAGFSESRIVKLGAADNFWGPAGNEGACGPCSEIYFDLGPEHACKNPECKVGCDCERYLEFWNLVFPQFYQMPDGKRQPLQRRGVDTGMGLERISFLMDTDAKNNYETLLFKPVIQKIKDLTDIPYEGQYKSAFHVIADHVRTLTFALSDGVLPSNDGRGYVLRRILRRALRFGSKIGFNKSFLYLLIPSVINEMKIQYPDLEKTRAMTEKIVKNEEEQFISTLRNGIDLIEECINDLNNRNEKTFPGDMIFKLYDTYGFPHEMIVEIAEEKGLIADKEGFKYCMEEQKSKGKMSWKGKSFSINGIEKLLGGNYPKTPFSGYINDECSASILAILKDDKLVKEVNAGDEAVIVLDKSVFYAESGGQVSDTGEISNEKLSASVTDVQKSNGAVFLHSVSLNHGILKINDTVNLKVDKKRRLAIQKNHTATHILQYVLRKQLGDHIKQAGSFVGPDRLRFDFSHTKKLSEAEIKDIENGINAIILNNETVLFHNMSLKDTKNDNTILANFGEKYDEEVRMVNVGHFSKELCGGIHIQNTGLINGFCIVSESSVSAGVRRIEALTGEAFIKRSNENSRLLQSLSIESKTPPNFLSEKFSDLSKKIKLLEKKVQTETSHASHTNIAHDLSFEHPGISVIVRGYNNLSSKELLNVSDRLKGEESKCVIFLGSIFQDQLFYVALQKNVNCVHCGNLIKEIATFVNGKGGGKPEMARGGGKNTSKFLESMKKSAILIKSSLKNQN